MNKRKSDEGAGRKLMYKIHPFLTTVKKTEKTEELKVLRILL